MTTTPAATSRLVPALLVQTVLWSSVVALLCVPPPGEEMLPPPGPFWGLQLTMLLLVLGAYVLNTRWAAPRLLTSKRLVFFVLLQVGMLGTILTVRQRLSFALNMPRYWAQLHVRQAAARRLPYRPKPPRWPLFLDPGTVMVTMLVLSVSTGLGLAKRTQQAEEARQELARVQLELERVQLLTEMSLLKAQLNPHFFFNTLNNIYALTRQDVEKARKAIHRLSRLMRYVLYDTQAGTTLLSQEVRFLQDYIELMQLRLTDQVQLTVEWPAPLHEVAVAPLLLLVYLENAFKHGVDTDAPSRIYVGLRQPTPETLAFEVRNTCPAAPAQNLEPGGIGLPNTQRRLELVYPGRHTLRITPCQPGGEYRVQLTLQLA